MAAETAAMEIMSPFLTYRARRNALYAMEARTNENMNENLAGSMLGKWNPCHI